MLVIVGRPNTGKSTLFNRLVGGRIAITLREPGITRDRIIRDVDWLGRRFKAVDTGGLVPDSKEEMSREVERQVQIALKDATVVVLVVDGATGLAPLDEEIARKLRKAGLRFITAVNKLDRRRDFDSSEFHRLGGELLVPLSAELGTGVDDLLDAVLARLPEAKRPPTSTALALAILGRPNVGKSSLMNRLLGRERAIVTPTPGTTRDVVEDRFEFEGHHYRLLDTAGIRRKPKVRENVEYYSVTRAIDQISHCDIAVVMFDAFDGPTNQDKRIINLVTERSRGMVIVANKMDLVPPDKKQPVRDWVKKELAFVDYVPVLFTSVLHDKGVTSVIHKAAAVWDSGGRQVSNAQLRGEVLPRLETRPPGRGTRVFGLSQVGTRPPVFKLRLSDPDSMEPAYERFVISELRRRYGFEGYPVLVKTGR